MPSPAFLTQSYHFQITEATGDVCVSPSRGPQANLGETRFPLSGQKMTQKFLSSDLDSVIGVIWKEKQTKHFNNENSSLDYFSFIHETSQTKN